MRKLSQKIVVTAALLALAAPFADADAHPAGKNGAGKESGKHSPQTMMMHQMMREMHGCMQQQMSHMQADPRHDGGMMDKQVMRQRMMTMMRSCMDQMSKGGMKMDGMPGGGMHGHGKGAAGDGKAGHSHGGKGGR